MLHNNLIMTNIFTKDLNSNFFGYSDEIEYNLDLLHNIMPPIIGCFVADKNGKTLFKYEIFKGALDSYLKKDIENEERKNSFDVELIPMFISALERFSQEINIKDLRELKLKGSNIKVQTVFTFDNYSIIFILNPIVNLSLIEDRIKNYFNYLFNVYALDFKNFKKMSTINFISHLQLLGRIWLKEMNNVYLQILKKNQN